MQVFEDMEQRSDEWFAARRGIPTASNFRRIFTSTGKVSAEAPKYMDELLAEAFSGTTANWGGNEHTERGELLEDEAIAVLSERLGVPIHHVGLIRNANVACSPDGMIKENNEWVAGCEVKCPMLKTHIKYIREGRLPPEYVPQVHGSMAVASVPVWHFLSYFPGVQPFYVRVQWSAYTDAILKSLLAFVETYKQQYEKLQPKLRLPQEVRS